MLQCLCKFIKSFYYKKNKKITKYNNLAATNNADENGIYSEALNEAINDRDVYNIALTGPYGSGKSSIIKTFLTNYPEKKVLKISLAAFLPETETIQNLEQNTPNDQQRITKQEIERSILQQMLYGQNANKLPLSRFKRIKIAKYPKTTITLFTLAFFAILYLFQNRTQIFSSEFLNISATHNFNKGHA